MKTNNRMVKSLLLIVISVVTVLVCLLNLSGVTYSRFNKVAMSSVVYGEDYAEKLSLSPEGKIFDFGIWNFGENEDPTHTIFYSSNTALNGKLKFIWDDVTASNKDVTVLLNQNVLNNDAYNVSEADGRIELPISLIVNTKRTGVAKLDVQWIPEGSNTAKATARYILTLNAESIVADSTDKPSFDTSETKFLTKNLLQVSLNLSDNTSGAMVSKGASILTEFKKSTVYFTEEYPQGVKLLNDSVLYFEKNTSGKVKTVINLGNNTSNSSVNISAGASFENYVTTSQTPKTDCFDVTLEHNGDYPVLSRDNPLKFTVTEASGFIDNKWNETGSSKGEIVWYIERFENGVYKALDTTENITVSVSQNSTGGTITLKTPKNEQQAGTYKLTVSQSFDGYKFGYKSITFFIDYR